MVQTLRRNTRIVMIGLIVFSFLGCALISSKTSTDPINTVELCTITLVDDGRLYDKFQMDKGGELFFPVLEKEGYIFKGWVVEQVPTARVYKGVFHITEDMTFYAKWNQVGSEFKLQYYLLDTRIQNRIPLEPEEEIKQMVLAVNHSGLLTSKGRLYLWGRNQEGQLGNSDQDDQRIPLEVTSIFDLQSGEIIIQFALGESHSAALTSLGRLFMWGSGTNGELGNNTTDHSSTPQDITTYFLLQPNETIASVALGKMFSAALTSFGRVFTWGSNAQGALGDGSNTNKGVPQDITSFFSISAEEQIVSLAFAANPTALTSKGRLFIWGANERGSIGDGTWIDRYYPTDITSHLPLQTGESIHQFSTGFGGFSAVFTSFGRVFTWGANTFGQLGDGSKTNRNTPIDITSNFALEIEEALLGLSVGGDFMTAWTSSDHFFTWGNNSMDQRGSFVLEQTSLPQNVSYYISIIKRLPIHQVLTGYQNCAMIMEGGFIYVWGSNIHGTLGLGFINPTLSLYPLMHTFLLAKEVQYGYYDEIASFEMKDQFFVHDGWFLDPEFTQPFTQTTMPNHNLVLYGRLMFKP